MSVMLVSYEQRAKGDKRESYYNMTLLWSYSVSMLRVMGGGRASSLYRHPVREGRIWGTVYTGYSLRGYIGYTGYTGYTVYGYNLIIISFINLIKPYTNTIKRFGRPIYRTSSLHSLLTAARRSHTPCLLLSALHSILITLAAGCKF